MTDTTCRTYCINEDYLESAFNENMFGDGASIEDGTSPVEIVIDESQPNHFVQLLFALKEDKSWVAGKWQTFTKEYLTRLIDVEYENGERDPNLKLIDELEDEEFKSKYPEEIDRFIYLLCDQVD